MMKILIFALVTFFQVVFSQQQQQEPLNFLGSGLTAAQLWDPNSWATPYYAAASQAWANYLKKAQEASNQLYRQWDVTGAGNLYNAGMGFAQQAASQAQQAASQAQQGAETAMKEGVQAAQTAASQVQKGAQTAAAQAQQGAETAMKEGAQAAQTAAAQAQQLLP